MVSDVAQSEIYSKMPTTLFIPRCNATAVDQPGCLCWPSCLFPNEQQRASSTTLKKKHRIQLSHHWGRGTGRSVCWRDYSTEFPVHSPGGEARHFIRTCSTLGHQPPSDDDMGR